MPIVASYSMPVGDQRSIAYSATQANGSAFDLTGYSLRFTLKATPVGGTPYTLQKTLTITNAAGGLATLAFVTTDTLNLTPDTYFFDIVAVNGAIQIPLTTGTFQLTERVSR